MGLEAATYIHQLNPAWPIGGVDPKAQGDENLRMIKATLQATFPYINGPVTVTLANLNLWAGLDGAYAWTGQHSWAQQLRAPDGAVGTPSYSFASDVDSGLYLSTANQPAIAAGGAVKMFWNAASVVARAPLYAPDGAAATPGYAFENDTDTGLYRISADRVGIATGGATRFTVGIAGGTDVVSSSGVYWGPDGSAANPLFSFVNDVDTGIYRSGNNLLAFAAAGGTPLVVRGDLANGQVSAVDGSVGVPAYGFQNDPDTGLYRSGTNELSISAGGTAAITIQSGLIQQNNGVFRFQDGNAGAPSQTYASDLDTGIFRAGSDQLAFSEGGTGYRIGFRQVPRSTTVTTLAIGDVGKCVAVSAAINIPASVFSAGDCISIYNDSASSVSITISAGTLRLAGTTTTGTRSLLPRGMATLWFNVGGATPEVIASGAGVG